MSKNRFPIFAERFKELRTKQEFLNKKKFTLKELSTLIKGKEIKTDGKSITITEQSLNNYENGQQLPDISRLYCICKVLNVSADYLLGLSDVQTPETDYQAINKMIGLTDEAITALRNSVKEKEENKQSPNLVPGLSNNNIDSDDQISYKHELVNAFLEREYYKILFERILQYINLDLMVPHTFHLDCSSPKSYDDSGLSPSQISKVQQQVEDISNILLDDINVEELLLQEIVRTLMICFDSENAHKNTKVVVNIDK